ncbi:MAG: acetoacetate--CoA ligase [Thiohalomonadales bacterium]
MPTIHYKPNTEQVEQSAMWRFMRYVNNRYRLSITDYPALHAWSINSKAEFWSALAEFSELRFSVPWHSVLDENNSFLGYEWFCGSRLNFAENLLRHTSRLADKPALVFWGEDTQRRSVSYTELFAQVAKLSQALRNLGVVPGDRIAAYMPNMPETVIAMLACTSLGAIWSSCSPDFGLHAVLDRFGQIRPKILFACDGYFFKGKAIDKRDVLEQLRSKLTCLERIILVSYIHSDTDSPTTYKTPSFVSKTNTNSGKPADLSHYQELLNSNDASTIDYAQLPFQHPVVILYSSGTTGKPKCIVHGAGGTLLQHVKELMLHCDVCEADRLFYFTTCGWMMWNWLVSGLSLGAGIMLYDGAPMVPNSGRLLQFAHEERISVFGTSAKYLAALEKAQYSSADQLHELADLRLILSTGSPLAPESYDYVQRHIKEDISLASISGGSDIISCFALANPLLPVYRGELQCIGLGMDVRILNECGEEILQKKGELCCRPPFPSMPVAFWEDRDNKRYKAAYFEDYPGYWAHGDYAERTANGGLIIYGRSDAVLNPGGVRIGTAEIYRQVEKLPQIMEAIAVAQEWQNDVRILLFVRLMDSFLLDDGLRELIKESIRQNTTARHVPAKIFQVADIPRTISGKIVELAVTNVIHNRPIKNLDVLANPEALDEFRDMPELHSK